MVDPTSTEISVWLYTSKLPSQKKAPSSLDPSRSDWLLDTYLMKKIHSFYICRICISSLLLNLHLLLYFGKRHNIFVW